jgi:glucokinase
MAKTTQQFEGRNELYVGVEIGGTKHQIALGNNQGELLYVKQGKVILEEGADGILRWLKEQIPHLISMAAEFGGNVSALGVGFGGVIESSSGRVVTSVQVKGWKDFKLKEWFEEQFKLPAVILNDTVAAGYGEYISGSGKGTQNFFYTNIGSGIGGVFILDGKCYDGNGFGAAYFGHTYIPDWTSELSGASRKVEDICSGWAIEKRLRSAGYVPDDSLLMKLSDGHKERITCILLADAARQGDIFANQEVKRIAGSFGMGLANVITLFSPDCVSIGGGVANMGDLLLNPIRQCVDERVFIAAKDRYRIVNCTFGDQAVLVGSILYAGRT